MKKERWAVDHFLVDATTSQITPEREREREGYRAFRRLDQFVLAVSREFFPFPAALVFGFLPLRRSHSIWCRFCLHSAVTTKLRSRPLIVLFSWLRAALRINLAQSLTLWVCSRNCFGSQQTSLIFDSCDGAEGIWGQPRALMDKKRVKLFGKKWIAQRVELLSPTRFCCGTEFRLSNWGGWWITSWKDER